MDVNVFAFHPFTYTLHEFCVGQEVLYMTGHSFKRLLYLELCSDRFHMETVSHISLGDHAAWNREYVNTQSYSSL